ncbi:MAG: argininosuccinate lyase [Chthonomonadales bacterium]
MSSSPSTGKLWGGRFSSDTDELVKLLNNSLPFDGRMWRQDIRGSIAHATMLGETGIIPSDDAIVICKGLAEIEAGLSEGSLTLDPEQEDIHAAVEASLREKIGLVAGKLHTARSRNDQVATDLRLYLRDALGDVLTVVTSLQETMLARASEETDTILPGCTHLQHGQPVLLAHHLLAYFWMFQRDRERLEIVRTRVNRLPLGAGAMAGTTFPINRQRVAELLKFDCVIENSMDAVADRDFAIEFLSAASILMVHLSRLAEEIIIWNSPEYGFVALDDSVTTGSSIMPQKKNPDVAELARGKTGRVFGNLMALLTVMKGLPLTYNKDMQEDKEPIFDTLDILLTLLPPFTKMIATAKFQRDRMKSSLKGDFSTATDLADLLVRQGMPFRDAHHVIGTIVKRCEENQILLEEMTPTQLSEFSPLFANEPDYMATVEMSVGARKAEGGTAAEAVLSQLEKARSILSS